MDGWFSSHALVHALMAIVISSHLHLQLREWGQGSPQEVCGLLFGEPGLITTASLAQNVADDPEVTFEIDPVALISAHKRSRNGGEKLVGCFHSHPNQFSTPSPRDEANAFEDGWIWLILTDHGITAWRANGRRLEADQLLVI